MKKSFADNLGMSIIPKRIRSNLKKYLMKTGLYDVPYSFYGKLFVLSFFIAIGIYIFVVFPALVSQFSLPAFLFGTFVSLTVIEFALVATAMLFLWLYYELTIFKRTAIIEEVLPDFLEEVSVNLRAGMSFDKALWNSVEPEFGILEKEIEIVAKKVMAGQDTEEALKEFAEKYNSTLLHETMDMIIIGIKSGGNISELIDKIVKNVKDAYYLRKELIASVTSYIIFISITAVIISPTLFALSFNLMEIIQSLGEKITATAYSGITGLGYKSVNPEDFILFSKISVIIISTVSAMITADLREGSIKAGLKYLFFFVPISYLVYIGMLKLFTGLFGVLV
jgi:pilus assembly protein TadC